MVDGFCKVAVAPLPKSQNQLVGLPVERSWNLTTNGEHPEVTDAVKLAVCAWERAINKKNKTVSVVFLLNVVDLALRQFSKGGFENVKRLQKLFLLSNNLKKLPRVKNYCLSSRKASNSLFTV